MKTQHRRTPNYELVYSTKNINTGSRDGNAGDRPARKHSGSRTGGAGNVNQFISNNERRPRRDTYTPADVLKKQQEIRKRGEDTKGEDYGNENYRKKK